MRYNLFSRAVSLLNQNQNKRGQLLLLRGAASNNASSLNAQPREGNSGQEEVTTATSTDAEKLPAREPLVKNFFLGLTDKELLGYPEVIPREEMVNLQNALLPLKNYFAEEQSTQLSENLKQLGLYGLNVPKDYEGRGYKWSASLMASEPEASHTSLALGLHSHRVLSLHILLFVTIFLNIEPYFHK